MRYFPNPKGQHHPSRPAYVRDRDTDQWTRHSVDMGPEHGRRHRTRGGALTAEQIGQRMPLWTRERYLLGDGLAKVGRYLLTRKGVQLGRCDDAFDAAVWAAAANRHVLGVRVEVCDEQV